MPEGDAIHRAAARLQPLVGHVVTAESPHPRGLLTGVAAAVDGRVLCAVEAVGKNLLLRFDGGVTVRSHLRMNGRWRVASAGMRRTGRPWLVLRACGLEATQWNGPVLSLDPAPAGRIGPDLLGARIDLDRLIERLRRGADPARPLGEALLDQRLVAGIGTMWLAECLWAARVSPLLALEEVSDAELRAALSWAREHMLASIRGARPRRCVYRRAGRPCPRCAGRVRSAGLGGDDNRTAYWCEGCQRRTSTA